MELLNGPLMSMCLFNLLIAWPVVRILRRTGLAAAWAWLLLVPALGFLLVLMALGHRHWPLLPPRPPKPARKPRREA